MRLEQQMERWGQKLRVDRDIRALLTAARERAVADLTQRHLPALVGRALATVTDLRHTEVRVEGSTLSVWSPTKGERQSVDTHGQSEVGFAFCSLLGFALVPRLKSLKKQRLYRPEKGQPERYATLQSLLTRPIQRELSEPQSNALITFATARRLGTADAEAILRRFTRQNVQPPTYRARCKLGKALKTTVLCDYLRLEALRREIHEGLQVLETWTSANDFILYGKGGEFATNELDNPELLMLSLHLLQVSLVSVNRA